MTQFESVRGTDRINERYLPPVLDSLPAAFPFRILGWPADGSEYLNHNGDLPVVSHVSLST